MPHALLTDRHAAKIRGVLACFDRIVLNATLPDICHAKVTHQTKYYLTHLGRAVSTAALGLTAFFLIPQLAQAYRGSGRP